MYCYFSASRSQMTAPGLSLLSILLLFLCELCTSETLSVFVVVIDVCWLTFILHVLLFFSQSQPNDSSESLPAIDSSSLPMWVMHVWDSLSLLFVIAAYWLTFILRVLLFFSQSQPDDSSLLASSHALWVMPGWDSVFFFVLIHACLLNFVLHVLLFFSQSQPPRNPYDTPNPNSSEDPKWVMVVCILF